MAPIPPDPPPSGVLNGKTPSSGKRNGNYRHGFYTSKAIAERRALRALINKLAD